MQISIGSFIITSRELRSYDEVENFALSSGIEGLLFGTNASHFGSFWGLEIKKQFGDTVFQIGIISDRDSPHLFPSPDGTKFVLGINSEIVVVHFDKFLEANEIPLDSCFQGFLQNQDFLVAVHELGVNRSKAFGRMKTRIISK